MTEHVRSLEPHVDFALAEATDFLRGDVGYDGITGVMKLAHAAEGLGLDIEFHGPGPAPVHGGSARHKLLRDGPHSPARAGKSR